MRIRLLLTLICAVLIANISVAQDTTSSAKSLDKYIKSGVLKIDTRTVFMSTVNKEQLKDDYALATGIGGSYASQSFQGFGFSVGGFFTYNVASSELDKVDPYALQPNRYETGLFDVADLSRKRDIGRLEEANIYYKSKVLNVKVGRMFLKTPFINPQDGRMRPTFEEGVQLKGEKGKFSWETAWLWSMSPRSTGSWYSGGNSIGLYPVGVGIDGKKSGYAGQVKSKGVGVAGVSYKSRSGQATLWSTYIENVSHTLIAEYEFNLTNGWLLLGQYTRQDRVGNGGNSNDLLAFQQSKLAQVLSGRLHFEAKKWSANFNYSQFSKQGRFLFPRELGREPFYTFMPRERNEGNGGVRAVTINYQRRNILAQNLSLNVGLGYYDMPAVTNFFLNKYGMDDYAQANLLLNYKPSGKWNGLSLMALIMAKKNMAGALPDKNVYNRVDMLHFEAVVNYTFTTQSVPVALNP